MAAKPGGGSFALREQIFEDVVTDITFQFYAAPRDSYAPFRLRLFGAVAYTDHEYMFDSDGVMHSHGTILMPRPRPNWLRLVKE